MSLAQKVRGNLRDAAVMARDGVEDMRTSHDLTRAYTELGRRTVDLMDAGKLDADVLEFDVDRIRALKAELEAEHAPAGA
jgi:hypothetical protein